MKKALSRVENMLLAPTGEKSGRQGEPDHGEMIALAAQFIFLLAVLFLPQGAKGGEGGDLVACYSKKAMMLPYRFRRFDYHRSWHSRSIQDAAGLIRRRFDEA